MKFSLRVKLFLTLGPLVALILYLLFEVISPYNELKHSVQDIEEKVSRTILTERFATTLNRIQRRYAHYVLHNELEVEQGLEKDQEKALETLTSLKLTLKTTETENRKIREEVEKEYLEFTQAGHRAISMVKQGKKVEAMNWIGNEIEDLTYASILPKVDWLVWNEERTTRRNLLRLAGLIGRLGILSPHSLESDITLIYDDVSQAIHTQRFARAINLFITEYAILSIVGTGHEEHIEEAKVLAQRAILYWKDAVIREEKELNLLNMFENETTRLFAMGLKVRQLIKGENKDQAVAIIVNEMEPLVKSLINRLDIIVNDKEAAISRRLLKLTTGARQIGWRIGLLSLVILAIGVGSPWLLARSIINPIMKLKSAVSRVGSGELETQISITSNNELGDLTAAFNVMSKSLKTSRDELLRTKERLQFLISANPAVIYSAKASGDMGFTFISENVTAQIGYEPFQFLQDSRFWTDHMHPEDAPRFLAERSRLLEKGYQTSEYRFLHKDGSFHWVHDEAKLISADHNMEAEVIGFCMNITERKQAEIGLHQTKEQLTHWVNELQWRNRQMTLLSNMTYMLQACSSTEEAYTVIAKSLQNLFPLSSGVLYVYKDPENDLKAAAVWGELSPGMTEDTMAHHDCSALKSGRMHVVKDQQAGRLCTHTKHQASLGSICIPMIAQGETLGVMYLWNKTAETEMKEEFNDEATAVNQLAVTVTESIALALANLRLRDTLRFQSIRDPLTSLFNRRYMEETLEREIHRATRNKHPLGILMIDLDHFKNFNDTFGHEAGDTLLREVGRYLKTHIRGEDIACRYGGEEFVLILPESSLIVNLERAEQLRKGIKLLQVHLNERVLGSITFSVGVANFPMHGHTAETLLRVADEALYRAKASGRDCVMTGAIALHAIRTKDNKQA